MKNINRDLAEILISKNIFTKLGADVFIGPMPVDLPKQGSICSIMEYSSGQSDYDGLGLSVIPDINRSIQICIRSVDEVDPYNIARQKSWQVFNALVDVNNRTIIAPSGRLIHIRANNGPTFLAYDDTNRVCYVFNLKVITDRDK